MIKMIKEVLTVDLVSMGYFLVRFLVAALFYTVVLGWAVPIALPFFVLNDSLTLFCTVVSLMIIGQILHARV